MVDKIDKKNIRDQLWELYLDLPKELQRAIFSAETAENIGEICEKNRIEEEKIPKIAEYVGQVLLGLLPPEELEIVFQKELILSPKEAEKISQEIDRLIFEPIKETLNLLYGKKTEPTVRKKPKRRDTYREPIE